MAKFKHPQILTCSDLITGDVMFLQKDDWSRDHRRAHVANTEEEAAALLARGMADFAKNRVIDVYLVDIAISADGHPEPIHYREKIRTLGPTMRLDLGKQAESTFAGDI